MRRESNVKFSFKTWLLILLVGFVVSSSVIILTVPLHETGHLLISTYLDPYVEVVEFHPFGVPASRQDGYSLPSALGCVIVKEAYPGAFQDRPIWADPVQEFLLLSIQILIACYVTLKTITYVIKTQKIPLAVTST